MSPNADEDRLDNKVVKNEGDKHSSKPVPIILISSSRESSQSINSDRPANPKQHKGNTVIPMIIAK